MRLATGVLGVQSIMKQAPEIEMSPNARTLLDAMLAHSKSSPRNGVTIRANTIDLRQISGVPHKLIPDLLGELRGRNLIARKAYGYWRILA